MKNPRGLTLFQKARAILTKIVPPKKAVQPQPAVVPTPAPAERPLPLPESPANGERVVFDERSEGHLRSLTPEAERRFRQWLTQVRHLGIPVVIIEGTRTFAEQAAIYAKGRTAPGPKVSWAPPGSSMHNYGVAIDFVVFEGLTPKGGQGKPLWGSPMMEQAGRLAMSMGLRWGGVWSGGKQDKPHIELPHSLSSLKQAMPKGWTPRK